MIETRLKTQGKYLSQNGHGAPGVGPQVLVHVPIYQDSIGYICICENQQDMAPDLTPVEPEERIAKLPFCLDRYLAVVVKNRVTPKWLGHANGTKD